MTHLTDEQLDALYVDLSRCVDYEDYENVAFHYVHQCDGNVSSPEFELPRLLVVAFQQERAVHQTTKAELERWKSLAEDAVERLAQYDDDYDLENGMDAGALANQDMIERLDAARAGQGAE